MLRYKTKTRPGLVALYDIRPGNGAGPFLQPGARTGREKMGGEGGEGGEACVAEELDRLKSAPALGHLELTFVVHTCF